MKVTKVPPVIPSITVTRRKQEDVYKSEIDPAVIIHSNKTHRTVSEAFRDAEYACSVTRFKDDWQLAWEFLGNSIVGFCTVFGLIAFPVLLIVWLTR